MNKTTIEQLILRMENYLECWKQFNTFMRLQSPGVIAALRAAFPELADKPDPKTVFVKLRELRNQW